MHFKYHGLFVFCLLFHSLSAQNHADEIPRLDNPMNVDYLKKNIQKKTPRIILTPEIKKNLQKRVSEVPELRNYYQAIKLNADQLLQEPLLERIKTGRRLLSVSREMLYRMGVLGMVYTIDGEEKVLNRINEELLAICAFSDWNPSHYLDVAEMSFALALAVDWVGKDLPKSTVELVKENLIEKGIKPSYDKDGNTGWVNGTNNWNQVCHGGMIAASIVIAEDNPALAAETISRALEGMPHAMVEYGPDGVYPEGSTYWGYGTSFSVLTSSMLQSAFGTDFGLAEYPAFVESADFRVLCNSPSGWYYNFADCGDKRSEQGDITLAWFATHTGNKAYYEKDRFLMDPASMGKLPRTAGPALVWMSQFEEKGSKEAPLNWSGGGANPIVIFRGGADDPHQYYFGGKGGRGTVNHGNMDGGSFIFELNGVRWSVDPGNQSYHTLEKTGFDLWGRCQDCERWSLITKNNYGHSTLTVNDALHVVDGFAGISSFDDGEKPSATIDLSATFAGQLESAKRVFTKNGPQSLLIEDFIVPGADTKWVTWQMMTTADVELMDGGALLSQDGQTLKLKNLSHPKVGVSIISLDPPPHELDRVIEGLKRIEIRIPRYILKDGENKIAVQLSGE